MRECSLSRRGSSPPGGNFMARVGRSRVATTVTKVYGRKVPILLMKSQSMIPLPKIHEFIEFAQSVLNGGIKLSPYTLTNTLEHRRRRSLLIKFVHSLQESDSVLVILQNCKRPEFFYLKIFAGGFFEPSSSRHNFSNFSAGSRFQNSLSFPSTRSNPSELRKATLQEVRDLQDASLGRLVSRASSPK